MFPPPTVRNFGEWKYKRIKSFFFWLCWVFLCMGFLQILQTILHGLLIAVASLVAGHKLKVHGLQ